jgi:hypothetical protein
MPLNGAYADLARARWGWRVSSAKAKYSSNKELVYSGLAALGVQIARFRVSTLH